MQMLSDKQRRYIHVLCTYHELDDELAHKIRVAVEAGITAADANRMITYLQQLPGRPRTERPSRARAT